MLKVFPNVCVLRVRMPISDDLSPRNFVTKIVKYEKVCTRLICTGAVVDVALIVVVVFLAGGVGVGGGAAGGAAGLTGWCCRCYFTIPVHDATYIRSKK